MSILETNYHEIDFYERSALWLIPASLSTISTGMVAVLCVTSKYYKNALGFM